MSASIQRKLILVCLSAYLSALTAETARAYTLVDWMRMWPNAYRGAPAAPVYPGVAPSPLFPAAPPSGAPGCGSHAAPSCGCSAPANCGTPMPANCGTPLPGAYGAPAPAAVPAPAPVRPLGGLFSQPVPQVAVSYMPEVQYRTSWIQVPTTNFRPITSVDPVSGAATTAMMPCTTYSWQIQRIPYTTYRPVYSTVPPAAGPFNGLAVVNYNAVPPAGSCAACGPAPVAPAAPYYAPVPGAASVPPAVPGLTPSPTLTPSPAVPGSALPAYPGQPSGTAVPGVPTPADQRPSLTPGEVRNMPVSPPSRSTLSNSPSVPPGAAAAAPTVPVPSWTIPVPPPPSGSGVPPNGASKSGAKVVPVPDPEAGQNRNSTPAAPTVFDNHDRTARRILRPVGDVSPIVWPEPTVSQSLPALHEPVADARGWQAVNP